MRTASMHDRSALDRRSFLRATAGGTTLLGIAALLPACHSTVPPAPMRADGQSWRFLDPLTLTVLQAAAEAIFAPDTASGAALPPEPGRTFMFEHLDTTLAEAPKAVSEQIPLLARAIEYGSGPMMLRPALFTSMTVSERQQALNDWMNSRIAIRRVAATSLKMLLAVWYWSEGAAWGHLGYDGPLLERADIPYFESHLALAWDKPPMPALPRPHLATEQP